MKHTNLIGCWIDGAYPRTLRETTERLGDIFLQLNLIFKHFDQEHPLIREPDFNEEEEALEYYDEMIVTITNQINEMLPETLEATWESGDFMIIEKE